MSRRSERVAGLVWREVGRLVDRRLTDPRLARLVTVARVRLSRDLAHATVAVSVLGGPEAERGALEGLDAASGYLRRELGRLLGLRRAPELRFVRDDATERGDRVLRLLDGLGREEGA